MGADGKIFLILFCINLFFISSFEALKVAGNGALLELWLTIGMVAILLEWWLYY